MPAIVPNEATEKCLRQALANEGYTLNPPRAHGETGADIIASKNDLDIYIEVIAYKSSGPARAKDFYESFFRAVSRIKNGADKCVIAIPHLAERGLPARASQQGEAWTRIGNAFPELEIWLVNVEGESYDRSAWNEWLKG